MTGPYCIVMHTTEIPEADFTVTDTKDWISGWKFPSHIVADPFRRKIVQCLPLEQHAKSLWNEPGGVETNTAGCIQVEIHMKSPDGTPGRPDLPDEHYRWLAAEVIVPICRWVEANSDRKIDLTQVPGITAIGNSARVDAPQRMSFDEWNQFFGICSHREVPENDHWDTGTLDLQRLARYASKILTPPDPPVVPPIKPEVPKVRNADKEADMLIHKPSLVTETSMQFVHAPNQLNRQGGYLVSSWLVLCAPATVDVIVAFGGGKKVDVKVDAVKGAQIPVAESGPVLVTFPEGSTIAAEIREAWLVADMF